MTSGKDLGHTYSKLVRVSGQDSTPAQPGSYHAKTNFTVDFGYPLQIVKRVSVLNVSFQNTAFNIIEEPAEAANNTFFISWNNGGPVSSKQYTIDPGFYNIQQLVTVMNAATADFKATVQPLANAASFVAPTTGTTVLNYGVGNNAGTHYQIFDNVDPTVSGPMHLMGFAGPADGVGVNPAPYVAENVPSLQGLTDAYIVSNSLAPGNCFDEKNQTRSILAAVPITVPFGTLNVFECKQDVLCEISYPKSRNIQKADFSLQDRYGNLVNLNGANLKLTLRVWFDVA